MANSMGQHTRCTRASQPLSNPPGALLLAVSLSLLALTAHAATPPTPSKVLTAYGSMSRGADGFEDSSSVAELKGRGNAVQIFADPDEVLTALKTDSTVILMLQFTVLAADNHSAQYKTVAADPYNLLPSAAFTLHFGLQSSPPVEASFYYIDRLFGFSLKLDNGQVKKWGDDS